MAVADQAVHQFDDIRVVIEDEDDSVKSLPDGSIAIDEPGGGVVVQLFPNGRPADEEAAEDPAKFYENLADKIGDSELSVIGEMLFEAVQADDQSRAEWLANRADWMDLLGLKLEDPRAGDGASAIDGQSVVVNPLMLEAVLKGWANAQAELLPAEGPCKIANYEPGAVDQQADELGEAFQRDMNYYLTTVATEFVPETQHMLLWGVYFGGSGFKKVYTHPLKKRPCSEQVQPEHLIVSDATKDLASCERITHVISMRQSLMKRYMAKGIYRKVALTPPTPEPNQVDEGVAAMQGIALHRDRPEDQPYTLWEIQCELDLHQFAPGQWKNTGVPLPYLVTMDKDTHQILSVRRDWKPEDEECTRKKMYVKYPYVPGPGFYGTGLAQILGNSTAAMTAAWREALDAGMYANFPAGIIDKLGGRQNSVDMRIAPGTLQGVETGGRAISDVVAQLPYKDVTPGLMTLIDKITEQSKAVGGSPDVPVGEGTANIPVGTMLAHIEQATKVMAAAHKGQHAAMDEEISLIADLFKENPEAFYKLNKKAPKGYWNEQKVLEAINSRTLVPKSDPNVPSHIHRVMEATAIAELAATELGKATLDPQKTMRVILLALRREPMSLMKPPAPPQQGPSAEEVMAQAKLIEATAKAKKNEVDLIEAQTKPHAEQVKAEASIKGKTIDLAKSLVTHSGDREDAHRDHQLGIAEHAVKARESGAKVEKMAHDAMIDRASLGVEQGKIGLGHRQADLAEKQHATETALAGAQHAHQTGVDQQKLGIEGAKVGIAGHQAETTREKVEADSTVKAHQAATQRHAVLHPPKPAGSAKKPKGKKK